MKKYNKKLRVLLALSVFLGVVIFVSCGGDDGGSPTSPGASFRDNGDGTVIDNNSGLIWLKDANCAGKENWSDALRWASRLASGNCGLSDGSVAGDWHLPSLNEFLTLVDRTRWNPALPPGHPFINVQWQMDAYVFYWTATEVSAAQALFMDLATGWEDAISKNMPNYMWPVRRGQ